MADITTELRIDGKTLSAKEHGESPLKEPCERVSEHVQDLIKTIACPVHGKQAERIVVEVDTKAGTVRGTPEGFCCDKLRELVVAKLNQGGGAVGGPPPPPRYKKLT